MVQKPIQKEDFFRPATILSKVKFAGKYEEELKKTIRAFEIVLEKGLAKKLCIDSIIVGNNNIKMHVDDMDRNILRMVNCIFRYDATNKRYGHCAIELVSNELSKKPRLHFVGKFWILDHEKINSAIAKDLEKSLDEIFQ